MFIQDYSVYTIQDRFYVFDIKEESSSDTIIGSAVFKQAVSFSGNNFSLIESDITTDTITDEDLISALKAFLANNGKYHTNVSWEKGKAPNTPDVVKEEYEKLFRRKYQSRLNSILEKKRNEFTEMLLNKVLGSENLREYERKETRAREALASNDFSFFTPFVQPLGITEQEYVNLIIQKADQWHAAEDSYLFTIGMYRSQSEDLISSYDRDGVIAKLQEIEDFNIAAIFAS